MRSTIVILLSAFLLLGALIYIVQKPSYDAAVADRARMEAERRDSHPPPEDGGAGILSPTEYDLVGYWKPSDEELLARCARVQKDRLSSSAAGYELRFPEPPFRRDKQGRRVIIGGVRSASGERHAFFCVEDLATGMIQPPPHEPVRGR